MICTKIHTTHYKTTSTHLIVLEMLETSIVYHKFAIAYDVHGVENGFVSEVDGVVIDKVKTIQKLFKNNQNELAFNLAESYVNNIIMMI
jgi:hypothetical protein